MIFITRRRVAHEDQAPHGWHHRSSFPLNRMPKIEKNQEATPSPNPLWIPYGWWINWPYPTQFITRACRFHSRILAPNQASTYEWRLRSQGLVATSPHNDLVSQPISPPKQNAFGETEVATVFCKGVVWMSDGEISWKSNCLPQLWAGLRDLG